MKPLSAAYSKLNCLLILSAIFINSGCQKNSTPVNVTENTATPPTTANPPEQTAVPAPTKQEAPKTLLHTDDKGHKWIGDVPYDVFEVFYNEPLQVAANNQPSNMVAANNTTGTNTPPAPGNMANNTATPPAAETKTPAPTATAAGGSSWKDIITSDQLQSEVKRLRNEISTKLKSVGEYNASFADIEYAGGNLAAMAIISMVHENPPNWKDKALAVRDLAAEVSAGANGGRGRENFEKCQAPFEKIITILNGSTPPDLKIPENKDEWATTAEARYLMKRMESAQAWLRLNVQNDKDFQAKKTDLLQENSVLAALTKVITHADYTYADEEVYQKFCQDLLKANEEIAKAANDNNFEQFQNNVNILNKVCSDCHLKYRFEN